MEVIIITYLLCWFWCSFEPIQNIINLIFQNIKPNFFTETIWQLLSCQYCSTLWVMLMVTGSIPISLASSLIAQIHKKIIE